MNPLHRPVKVLPPEYQSRYSLNLSRNKKALIGLNALALAFFFVFGWIAASAADRIGVFNDVRIEFTPTGFDELPVFLGVLIVVLVVHELIHGFFFWIITRDRPKFGIRGLYAYAAAPDWYMPRNLFLIVGLAPFVLITVMGMFIMLLGTPQAAKPILFGITLNAAGSTGDLAVVGWLLTLPDAIMVNDVGDEFTVYVLSDSDPE